MLRGEIKHPPHTTYIYTQVGECMYAEKQKILAHLCTSLQKTWFFLSLLFSMEVMSTGSIKIITSTKIPLKFSIHSYFFSFSKFTTLMCHSLRALIQYNIKTGIYCHKPLFISVIYLQRQDMYKTCVTQGTMSFLFWKLISYFTIFIIHPVGCYGAVNKNTALCFTHE